MAKRFSNPFKRVQSRLTKTRRPKSGPVLSSHTEHQKKHLRALTTSNRFPSLAQLRQLPRLLSKKERGLFWGANVVAVISLIALVVALYIPHLFLLPSPGGSYTEGLIGTPQFVNPLYASANDVDQDIASLVYSGLMKWDPSAGLIPDLAESYTISEDERVYTFSLRDEATWHDGTRVTPRDIIFTYNTIQNPDYRSPLAGSFQDVSIEQVNERTVSFTLSEPFAPFLSSLTVGILPADHWGDISPSTMRLAERNLIPIGSGPYQFEELEKNKQGVIQSYTLERYPKYYGGEPMLETITFKFYTDALSAVAGLRDKRVEGIAFVPADQIEEVQKVSGVTLTSPRLPQITALFFNLDRDNVSDVDLRSALGKAIDKEMLVNDVFAGSAAVTHGPIITSYITDSSVYENPTPYSQAEAAQALEDLGWTLEEGQAIRTKTPEGGETQTLALTINTVNQTESVLVAQAIADQWKAIGVDATVEAEDATTFRDSTVRNRDYDVLLSGILMRADPDPYPFWHSSQQDAPGLNLSQFANRDADTLIEEARATSDITVRQEKYAEFTGIVNETLPAIFLYQPTYAWATASRIRGMEIDAIVVPSDRFGQVQEWFIKTKKRFQLNANTVDNSAE